jgi:hypothetical protein
LKLEFSKHGKFDVTASKGKGVQKLAIGRVLGRKHVEQLRVLPLTGTICWARDANPRW